MTLVKYNPSTPSLGGWMDDFFNSNLFPNQEWGSNRFKIPAVNIRENADSFELELAAPGLEKKDFQLSVDNGMLTISAQKDESRENGNSNYTTREWSYNSFSRSFSLPEIVKEDGLTANYYNGVLRVTLPKKEEAKKKPARSIKIS